MEYVLYAISVVCFGIGIFFYIKNKAGAKIYMLMALEIAEKAAKLTKNKIDDQLLALLREAIESEGQKVDVDEVVKKMK